MLIGLLLIRKCMFLLSIRYVCGIFVNGCLFFSIYICLAFSKRVAGKRNVCKDWKELLWNLSCSSSHYHFFLSLPIFL